MTKQERIAKWVFSTFGGDVLSNTRERALRLVEEAVELAQALHVSTGDLHRLIDYVYSRPAGEPAQEVAGTMVTLYAVAASLGVDADAAFEVEALRIHTPEIIAKCQRRQGEKRAALITNEVEGTPV